MLSKFSVKKPFTVIVGIIIVLILGVVSYTKMTLDLIPSINLPYAVVATTYIGASPEEVETTVTSQLEQTLASINNMKNLSSTSSENMSFIFLEFNEDTNMDTALIEMRENLDMLKSQMPEGVGSPMIMKINPDMMPVYIFTASVEGMEAQEASKYIEDKIIPEVKSVDGVASVTPTGLISNMIDVTISQEKINTLMAGIATKMSQMQASSVVPFPAETAGTGLDPASFQITKEMISGILKGQNFAMPSGSVSSADGTSYLVRVGEKIKSPDELKNLVLMDLPMIGKIMLSDVADIGEYDNSNTMYAKVNGNHAFMLAIQKQPDFSTAEVSKLVTEKLDNLSADNSALSFSTMMNQGKYVDQMIGTIVKNLIIGAIFAILILFIFLRRIKPTLIVGTSIIISVITAFVLMYFAGVSLNMISMGGLALGVGMLVDNSIVVIENIYRLKADGLSAREAAIQGTKEVSGAITASTLTTIIVFVPIVFTTGITKQLFTDMALTIAFSLVASLLVALTLVPAAASAMLNKNDHLKPSLIDKMNDGYVKVLDKSLKHKWISIVLVIVLFAGSIFAAFSSGVELFPEMDSGEIAITVEVPDTYSKDDIFKSLDTLSETLSTIEDIDTIGIMYSEASSADMSTMFTGTGISVYSLLKENRKATTNEVVEEIREKTKDFEFTVTPSSSSMDISAMSGGDIVVTIFGRNLDNLRQSATEVAGIISSIDGTTEVDNGLGKVKEEIRIVVDKDKAIAKNLTVAQVYMAISEKIATSKSAITISDAEMDYDVFVKDGKETALTDADLKNIIVKSPTGEDVVASDIAELVMAEGFTSINHNGQERHVTISGTIKDGFDKGKINTQIKEKLKEYKIPAGYRYEIGGEAKSISETFGDLFLMLGMAILFIYLVMVAQFQSLKSPFIVMFTIPLAFTGGFAALFFTGTSVSVISLIGLVILVGVVVNNGIVFVDYTNQQVEKGMTVREALLKTGQNRLRPILMTALTTICALILSAIDTSSGAEMLKPIAITTIGGLTYATILTLFLVPTMYAITHRKIKVKKITD